MRLLFFVALSFLALAAQVCSGRPQVNEGTADLEWTQADAITTESIQDASSEKDAPVTVIGTLRDISKTLKEKFIILGNKIKEKMNQLKQAAGDQAQKIKSQLNDLRQQLKDSVQALKRKVQALFDKGQYASIGEHAIEVFGKIVEIRDKLNEFIKGLKDVTGEKLKQMQELAKQLRQQIKMKVQELLHGSSDSQTAVYYVNDDNDVDDSEAYVIATLKDISKSLKEKFLLLVEHLKEKFAELKKAGSAHAEKIKGELQILMEQMADAREAMKQKVQELFKPAQYASFGEHAMEIFAKLGKLREKLNKFLEDVKKVTGEKVEMLRKLIKETREEIKKKIKELIQGSSDSQVVFYHVSDDDTDEDNEAYVIATLKDISKTLKEKFLILVENLKEKYAELKKVGNQHAENLKAQIQALKERMYDARDALKQKLQELFKPAQYASFGEHAMEIFAKLGKLREKLNKFLEDVKKVTGEKVEMLRKLIKETREEIKKKIKELIQGSSDPQMVFYHVSDDDTDEDNEAYLIATLKDISKTLKEKFLILVENLKQKYNELKKVGDQYAENLKAQIQALKERMYDARDALKQKVQELFKPAQYASFGEHAMEIFAKLENLREKLKKFLEDVKKVTGEKVDKLRELIKETRQEIKSKIQELIEGSNGVTTALYQASDADEDAEAYIIDTLKDISKALKEKFLVLGERIAQKVQDIKTALGQRAEVLKKQLQELKGQLSEASDALKKKVLEMIRPEQSAQYGMFDGISSAVSENLATLRTRLEKFLNKVQKLAGEKWVKMQEMIRDLRNEIKQSIRKLLQGKAEVESTGAPEHTSAIPLQY